MIQQRGWWAHVGVIAVYGGTLTAAAYWHQLYGRLADDAGRVLGLTAIAGYSIWWILPMVIACWVVETSKADSWKVGASLVLVAAIASCVAKALVDASHRSISGWLLPSAAATGVFIAIGTAADVRDAIRLPRIIQGLALVSLGLFAAARIAEQVERLVVTQHPRLRNAVAVAFTQNCRPSQHLSETVRRANADNRGVSIPIIPAGASGEAAVWHVVGREAVDRPAVYPMLVTVSGRRSGVSASGAVEPLRRDAVTLEHWR